jgi:signal transduction histidine kinase
MTNVLRYFFLLGTFIKVLNSFGQQSLKVEIDGRYVAGNERISLDAGYHNIIFHFPIVSDSVRYYSFRIVELEPEWNISQFPQARYTNLSGGKYRFVVKSKLDNKSEEAIVKDFEIRENFWEKWWFYLFVVLFSIAGISLIMYFWFLYDLRQKLRTQAMRQKIAADLHDEVGANLSSISFLVESLKKKLNGQKEQFDPILNRISSNSLETVGLINDTIWALNPDYDNFEKLIERIKSFASSILSSKDIAFEINSSLQNTSIELSIEHRRNLYFIMKEAINNIAKHSKASKARLSISDADNELKISIHDNGVGMDTRKIMDGNGLKNYELRSIESNIRVGVISDGRNGSLIEIRTRI